MIEYELNYPTVRPIKLRLPDGLDTQHHLDQIKQQMEDLSKAILSIVPLAIDHDEVVLDTSATLTKI